MQLGSKLHSNCLTGSERFIILTLLRGTRGYWLFNTGRTQRQRAILLRPYAGHLKTAEMNNQSIVLKWSFDILKKNLAFANPHLLQVPVKP